MAIVCPYCTASADLSAEKIDAAGRMLRCTNCGTSWLARSRGEAARESLGDRPVAAKRIAERARFEKIVDADVLHVSKGVPRRPAVRQPPMPARDPIRKPEMATEPKIAPFTWRFPLGRRAMQALSGGAAALVLAILIATFSQDSSVADAAPSEDLSKYSGLEIRLLRGAVERLPKGRAVIVEGEITNITGGVLAVPAVRVSLKSEGVERQSWSVEPVETRVLPGDVVAFRSVKQAPPIDVDEVAFRLTERSGTIIGMR